MIQLHEHLYMIINGPHIVPQVDEMRLFSYEDGDLDFSDQDEIPSIPNGVQLISSRGMSSTMETQTQQVCTYVGGGGGGEI